MAVPYEKKVFYFKIYYLYKLKLKTYYFLKNQVPAEGVPKNLLLYALRAAAFINIGIPLLIFRLGQLVFLSSLVIFFPPSIENYVP